MEGGGKKTEKQMPKTSAWRETPRSKTKTNLHAKEWLLEG